MSPSPRVRIARPRRPQTGRSAPPTACYICTKRAAQRIPVLFGKLFTFDISRTSSAYACAPDFWWK